MALPTKQKTWIISPNNRVVFASLVQTSREILFGFKNFIKANGIATKGSCNGTTGAMDGPGTDRWAAATDAGTRGATTTTPVSWWCGLMPNGVQVLFSYVGGTDDVFRVSFSPGGLFVLAGTPTHTPTATDEQVICSSNSTIDATTSLDRIWNGWIDSSANSIRFMVFRNSAMVGRAWGVETVSSRVTAVPYSPAVWGFCYTTAGLLQNNFLSGYSVNTQGGLTRINGINVSCGGGAEIFLGNFATFAVIKPELQGAVGYPIVPLSIGSNTVGARGPVADLIDWWLGRTSGAAEGDVYGNAEFVTFGGFGSGAPMLWPWDGTPSIPGTAVVIA